eukprot:11456392-Alexandrium_andersonii.AAC.1
MVQGPRHEAGNDLEGSRARAELGNIPGLGAWLSLNSPFMSAGGRAQACRCPCSRARATCLLMCVDLPPPLPQDISASLVVQWVLRGELQRWCATVGLCEGIPETTAALEALWSFCVDWCRRHRLEAPQFNVFRLNILGRTSSLDFPVMSSKVKAMTMKVVISFLADIAPAVGDADLLGTVATACICSAAGVLKAFDSAKLWFSQSEADETARMGRTMLCSYAQLARAARANRHCLWYLRPKLHYADHIFRHIRTSRINYA